MTLAFGDLVKKVASLEDDKFPDFIYDVQFHEYEDTPNYWYEYDHSDERLRLLETLPKIKDPYEYVRLKRLWKSYVRDVADKHGMRPKMILAMFQLGLITEYIPKPPRISKKTLKRIEKGNMPAPRRGYGLRPYLEVLQEVDQEDPERTRPALESDSFVRSPTEKEARSLGGSAEEVAARNRVRNFRRKSSISHLELLGQYYDSIERRFSSPEYGSRYGDSSSLNEFDLDAAAREGERLDVMPEWRRQLETDLSVRNSALGTRWDHSSQSFVTEQDIESNAIMTMLAKLGVNLSDLYNGRMSKREIQLMHSLDGGDDIKRRKKAAKKAAKLAAKHKERVNSLASVLTENGYHFLDE